VLLLLIQFVHAIHSMFRVRVTVRFCFCVGVMVNGGQKNWDLILATS